MTFEEFELKQPILDAVKKAKFTELSPIQEQAIPILLQGRDIVASAQTGTGKTAAFVLPILHRLEVKEEPQTRALILTPTRELAVQIFENCKKFGRYMKLRACCVYGGAPQRPQRIALRQGCDILIATPGRLKDFMEQGMISLDDIEILVLDEADRMLDMGFMNDVKEIISKTPAQRQSILCSATMPKEIKKLAKDILIDPVDIRITPSASPAETVTQYLIYCTKGDKKRALAEMLRMPSVKKSIVFTRTKVNADRLQKRLEEVGISSLVIHGDKTQGQRMNALQRFRTNQVLVLIATDVAARGIDISDVTHVFNYELPDETEAYIHRIGRAGRAGKEGYAVTLCCEEELTLLANIEKMLGHELEELETIYSVPFKRRKPSSQTHYRRSDNRSHGNRSHAKEKRKNGNHPSNSITVARSRSSSHKSHHTNMKNSSKKNPNRRGK